MSVGLGLTGLEASEITGKVVGVHDGDSLTLLTPDKTQIKVRLEGIDAPELKQPFGAASKKALSDLVFGKTVRLEETGKDRYRRTLGNIFVGDVWVNLAMVERGMAWFFVKYSKEATLESAEIKARKMRLGLWGGKDQTAPWEWRKSK
ncbi:Endonuclease YncB, thermonuclease family [Prosthecobacter debontii]|uniref:Endonuclease YncB, thermonuclease family n=2 Tax=Prosthecobacter debontii TaxID=48467 RepID=A0A1T4X8K5_9BACT|nr:Endonuclease YncB, thermonuclease family [Prosthecobacter debontii]